MRVQASIVTIFEVVTPGRAVHHQETSAVKVVHKIVSGLKMKMAEKPRAEWQWEFGL